MESLNILFTGKDQVEVHNAPVPALESGQILVQSARSLISTGTECICLGRKFAPGTHWDAWLSSYPMQPGYSNAGTVLEVAADVTEVKPGDRVATRTGHQQYVVTSGADARKIPHGVSDEDATWFGLANITQNGVRRAEHKLGDVVVIVGLGLLGQLVAQYTALSGAGEIIAIDTAPGRLAMAKSHGATHTLQMGVAEAEQAVRDITGGRLADVVYDITGHPAVFAPALKLVRNLGTLQLLGDTGTPGEQRLTHDVVTRGVKIVGAHDSNPPAVGTDYAWWSHRNMTQLFFRYIERGQMRVDDLVTHRFAPADAPAAYHLLQTDRATAMGVVFDWSQA